MNFHRKMKRYPAQPYNTLSWDPGKGMQPDESRSCGENKEGGPGESRGEQVSESS